MAEYERKENHFVDIQNHPAVLAIREIKSLQLLGKSNPTIIRQSGLEFLGEQSNMVTMDTLLALSQKYSKENITSEELESFMPALCRFCKLDYDGLFITLQ